MSVEIKVPVLPESVSDATVSKWYKKVGDAVTRDENLVDLETDKVMLEVPAPNDGVIEKIVVEEGAIVTADEVLAIIKEGAAAAVAAQPVVGAEAVAPVDEVNLSPSVRRMVGETGMDVTQVTGTGKGGRITKQDIQTQTQPQPQADVPAQAPSSTPVSAGRVEKRVPMSRLRARIA